MINYSLAFIMTLGMIKGPKCHPPKTPYPNLFQPA